MDENYDLVIIGAGKAGQAAAHARPGSGTDVIGTALFVRSERNR